jgi:hypothetical protein
MPVAESPFQFILGLKTSEGPMQFCVDFGDRLNTILSIMAEYAPQLTEDSYRAVIAGITKVLPAVYFLEDGKTLRQLNLVGWE